MAATDDEAHTHDMVVAAVRELHYQRGDGCTMTVEEICAEGGLDAAVVERVLGRLEQREDIMCKRVASDPLAWKIRT